MNSAIIACFFSSNCRQHFVNHVLLYSEQLSSDFFSFVSIYLPSYPIRIFHLHILCTKNRIALIASNFSNLFIDSNNKHKFMNWNENSKVNVIFAKCSIMKYGAEQKWLIERYWSSIGVYNCNFMIECIERLLITFIASFALFELCYRFGSFSTCNEHCWISNFAIFAQQYAKFTILMQKIFVKFAKNLVHISSLIIVAMQYILFLLP